MTTNNYPRIRYPDLRENEIVDLNQLYKSKNYKEFSHRVAELTGKFIISNIDDRLRNIGESMERFQTLVNRDINFFTLNTETDPQKFNKNPKLLERNILYYMDFGGKQFLEMIPEIRENLALIGVLSEAKSQGNEVVLEYVHYNKDGEEYHILEGCHTDYESVAHKIEVRTDISRRADRINESAAGKSR